jgi:hypothetical protein
MTSLELIARRKQALVNRSYHDRNEIARVVYKWQARRQVAGQVTKIFKNPLFLSALGLLALKLPWKRTFKMSGWFWKGWKLFRLFRRIV